jgi:tRNA-dihydrouridine synthase
MLLRGAYSTPGLPSALQHLLKTKEVKSEIRAVTDQLHEHSEDDLRVAPDDEPHVARCRRDISSVTS